MATMFSYLFFFFFHFFQSVWKCYILCSRIFKKPQFHMALCAERVQAMVTYRSKRASTPQVNQKSEDRPWNLYIYAFNDQKKLSYSNKKFKYTKRWKTTTATLSRRRQRIQKKHKKTGAIWSAFDFANAKLSETKDGSLILHLLTKTVWSGHLLCKPFVLQFTNRTDIPFALHFTFLLLL